jgi:hypothetical protein
LSKPARSILVFGIYLAAVGICFIFIPNIVLPIFGFATTTEVWVRLVGLLTLILGLYFFYSVRYEDRTFFRATIMARLVFFTGLTLFVILGWGSAILIAFGLVDLAGAALTWLTLRST